MTGLYIILTLALAAILSPWIRFVFKRLHLAVQLARYAKGNCKLRTSGAFWMFSGIRSPRVTFCLEFDYCVYSVKLVGTPFRGHFYNFLTPTSYIIHNTGMPIMKAAVPVPPKTRSKEPFDFTAISADSFYGKEMKRIILMYPVSSSVFSAGKVIGNGDPTPEGVFYTKSGLFNMLKERER